MNHPKLQPVYTITVIVITIIQRINWVGKNQSSHAAAFKNKVIAFFIQVNKCSFQFSSNIIHKNMHLLGES